MDLVDALTVDFSDLASGSCVGIKIPHCEDESCSEEDEDYDHEAGVFAHVFDHDILLGLKLVLMASCWTSSVLVRSF